mgnify:CR=1 FL=1
MSHGSSPAAWTAVLVCLAGFIIGGVALIPTPNWTVFTVGAALVVAALPLGKVLSMAGMGADSAESH